MHKWVIFRLVVVWMLCGGMLQTNAARAALTLESSFNVTQTYTDNLFFEPNNTKSDLGTFLGPNFTLRYDNPDIVLGGTYFGRLLLFAKNSNENTYFQSANVLLDLPFLTKQYKGLTVKINESMTFTPVLDAFALSGAQDISSITTPQGAVGGGRDESQESGFSQGVGGTQGVFTSRASAFNNIGGITFGYVLLPRFSPTLQYQNLYRHFFSGDFQDSMTQSGSLSLPYRVTAQTTVSPSYTYWQTKFLGQSTASTSADKIISHNPSLAISHSLSPSLTVTANGGVAFVKQKNAEEDGMDLSGKWQTVYMGGFSIMKTYHEGKGGTASLDARQIVGSGGGLAAQATRTRVITGRIQHRFSQQIYPFAAVAYAQNNSVDGDAFDTDTYRIQVGLNYSFKYWLIGTLNYSHLDQRSKGSAANDLQVNQVFLGLTAIADPWVLMR
ncbi:hypothetical protein [Candidatus Nitrospira neomarina]|uniref:Porin n=1 Tax=Candidatus Nitrospira neomarina TaxID=3020899 RepID=A0AA96GKA0_9BACT|nr:hypothetical protein [Candidatus Nitrospira neomarina]WNM64029.1 hypothetical protein PQG83_09810 [Candidatus Nitrospira neomarina]